MLLQFFYQQDVPLTLRTCIHASKTRKEKGRDFFLIIISTFSAIKRKL